VGPPQREPGRKELKSVWTVGTGHVFVQEEELCPLGPEGCIDDQGERSSIKGMEKYLREFLSEMIRLLLEARQGRSKVS